MKAPRQLAVPAEVRKAPNVNQLDGLPANVLLHPKAVSAPVPQWTRAGRRPSTVVNIDHARSLKSIRESKRKELLEQLETATGVLALIPSQIRHFQDQAELIRQELAKLDGCPLKEVG